MNRERTRTAIAITLLLASLAAGAEIRPTRTAMVPMRDGVRLATDIYLPSPDARALPVILVRTPYGRRRYNREYGSWTRWGYAVAIQDLRGRFESEGRALAFLDDGWGAHRDGADTVAWLARQPFSNGRVGTMGASAMGITQYLLAPAAPDALICQYILVAPADLYRHAAYPGGVLRKSLVEGWLRGNGYDETLELVRAHPLYDAAYWRGLDATAEAARVRTAAIHYGGWFDPFIEGTIAGYLSRTRGAPMRVRRLQKLVIGPWLHGGPSAVRIGDFRLPENARAAPAHVAARRWFDRWLKGIANGAGSIPAATYYVMGPLDGSGPGNVWRTSPVWPPPAHERTLYLHRDGTLRWEPPEEARASLSYRYDPRDPVPTAGGANLILKDRGPRDQRPIESRADLLVFSSEALPEPLEVTGPVRAHLWITSTARDTDFAVRLTDVYPDGRSILLCDGIRRAALREGFARPVPLEPGRPTPVSVDVGTTALVFAPGHRIRIIVSSANAPRFEPNPNTAFSDAPPGATIVARNGILVDRAHPSRIVLPVVIPGQDPRHAAGR